MRKLTPSVAAVFLACTNLIAGTFPTFKPQQRDEKVTIGYGVLLLDLNADRKADIIVADSKRVIWSENPTWKMHVIVEGQTLPDNVAIAPIDMLHDGKTALVL